MDYDVFISHASEDKESFVEPLANTLREAGLKVWYDRFELKLGDSLREKIDQGLANSTYGVVVLSEAFFAKEWPKSELDALVSRQNSEGKKVILPIWHDVTAEEVKKFSPILASKMAARSSDGIEAVVAQILDVVKDESPTHQSVFQMEASVGLRERCLDVIRSNEILVWRSLLDELTEPIPAALKEWKQEKGEQAAHKGGMEWRNAVLEAVDICVPGFVPIIASIEAGKLDFWKESFRFVRRLAILSDEMGGGATWTIKIGDSMLYLIGHLGMSMAVNTHQLSLIDTWMKNSLQYVDAHAEITWLKLYAAHHYPRGLQYNPQNPYELLREIGQNSHLINFFPNQDRFVECAYLTNLLCSLIDLRDCISNETCNMNLTDNPEQVALDVWPVWPVMNNERFSVQTIDLFQNSKGVLDFVLPDSNMTADQFWPLWKQWKKVCSRYGRHDYYELQWKLLPGEPTD